MSGYASQINNYLGAHIFEGMCSDCTSKKYTAKESLSIELVGLILKREEEPEKNKSWVKNLTNVIRENLYWSDEDRLRELDPYYRLEKMNEQIKNYRQLMSKKYPGLFDELKEGKGLPGNFRFFQTGYGDSLQAIIKKVVIRTF